MNGSIKRELLGKKLLRCCWEATQTARVGVSAIPSRHKEGIRLSYGGARGGELGGPQVKIRRLKEFFPESFFNYNLVYLLSNASYLSKIALHLTKIKGIPIVLNQNGVFYPGWYGGDWQKMNNRMAVAYHAADYVFWQSEFCRRAADTFLGKREAAGEILFNAIDTRHRFVPAVKRPERPFTFLLTGRIDTHMSYRLESTIAGLAAARSEGLDCRLIIAGRVHREVILSSRQMIVRLGLDGYVDFLGEYTQEEAPVIYQSADAYVMTKYLDPCPNTVLEAMACGLPVLYSASGGVTEQVGTRAGVGLNVQESWDGDMLTPSPDEIGEGMVQIYNNFSQMSIIARHRAVTKFDILPWIAKHCEIFARLLGKRN